MVAVDVETPEAGEPTPAGKQIFTPVGRLLSDPQPVDWLIRGWLERNTVAALIAEPGRGKSFAALDLACCVALGRDWHGIPTKKAPVLYFCGEGRAAMIRRACAWSIVYGDLSSAPLYLSAGAVTLNDSDALGTLQAEIDAMPEPPGLLIVDTVARSISGDENSGEAMGSLVAALDTLRERYRCTCLVIHHPSKMTPGEPRGHSSLKGAIDTMMTLEARDGGVIVLINPKQRGSDPAKPRGFQFRTVELPPEWSDDDGTPTESAVLAPCDIPNTPARAEKGLGDKQRHALSILKRLVAEAERNLMQIGRDPRNAKVEIKTWRAAAKEEAQVDTRNFSRLAKALEDKGLVSIDGAFVSLLDASSASSASNEANDAGSNVASSASNAFRHDANDARPDAEAEVAFEEF
ncbi:MAG: AAA family ATPase [Acidithiobacillus sp.]|nr:AAA family ATPase [Acidithiobacillus sp.]